MSTQDIIRSIIEIILFALILIAFLNEDFLVLIERKMFRKIKRRFKKLVKRVIG